MLRHGAIPSLRSGREVYLLPMFLLILVLAAGLFALNAQRLYRYITLGYAEYRLNDPGTRIANLLAIGIFQRKIFREAIAGAMHATIFW